MSSIFHLIDETYLRFINILIIINDYDIDLGLIKQIVYRRIETLLSAKRKNLISVLPSLFHLCEWFTLRKWYPRVLSILYYSW